MNFILYRLDFHLTYLSEFSDLFSDLSFLSDKSASSCLISFSMINILSSENESFSDFSSFSIFTFSVFSSLILSCISSSKSQTSCLVRTSLSGICPDLCRFWGEYGQPDAELCVANLGPFTCPIPRQPYVPHSGRSLRLSGAARCKLK